MSLTKHTCPYCRKSFYTEARKSSKRNNQPALKIPSLKMSKSGNGNFPVLGIVLLLLTLATFAKLYLGG